MSRRLSILIVDDDARQAQLLAEAVARMGQQTQVCRAAEDALDLLKKQVFHLVITDMRMPGVDGLEFLRRLKELDSDTEVILVTAFASVGSAVEAIKLGAVDYFEKPVNLAWLEAKIRAISERVSLRAENRQLKAELARMSPLPAVVGRHPAFIAIIELIEKVAPSDASVLLLGESGTGKEVLARLLHSSSPRARASFVAVNCGAIPENLLESEFFGHVQGAFTGADAPRKGRIEDADGGSIFLDEIAELPLNLQPKLLRVIQSGEFSRVGSNKLYRADVRWIAATNRDLPEMVRSGNFREDLYYRLAVIPVQVPPLRRRAEDVPLFVIDKLQRLADKYRMPLKSFSPAAVLALQAYSWPGNVRELENLVERMFLIAGDNQIQASELPPEFDNFVEEGDSGGAGMLQEKVNNLEKACIVEALAATGGNQSEAARSLGINERTLRYKMKKLGIPSASSHA